MRKLIDAILASPDDDAPRLVYADWLLERGDPRGELITLQCKIAAAEDRRAPEIEALRARSKKLLKAHQKTWLGKIREHAYSVTWRRGFVDEVAGKAAKLLPGLPKLFAVTPLTTASFTGFDKKLHALFAATPALTNLRNVGLFQARIGPTDAVLFHSPHLSGAVRIEASRNALEDAGMEVLAEAPHLDSLRTLSLARCGLGTAGVVALSKAKFFPKLRRLDLSNNSQMWGDDLRGEQLGTAFARAKELRELDLGWSQVDDDAVIALSRAPGLKKLEKLDLHRYGTKELSIAAIRAIVESPILKKLKDLEGVYPYQRIQLAKGKKLTGTKLEAAKMLNERFGPLQPDFDDA